MSQAEVIKYLRKHKNKWCSTKEIDKGLSISSASSNLNKLFKYGEVLKKKEGCSVYWKLKDTKP